MKSHDPENGPCPSMRGLLDEAADGRTSGWRARYARAHASRCPGCGRYLTSIEAMVHRLKGSREPEREDSDALARLAAQLDSPSPK